MKDRPNARLLPVQARKRRGHISVTEGIVSRISVTEGGRVTDISDRGDRVTDISDRGGSCHGSRIRAVEEIARFKPRDLRDGTDGYQNIVTCLGDLYDGVWVGN
jgi:hypothetical protein